MASHTLDPADRAQCPHCKAELEGPAEDYVIPGRPPGAASQVLDCCEYCNEEFAAKLLEDGRIHFTTL